LAKNVVAALGAGKSSFNVPFFEVRYVAAQKGWGPFIYDVAMSLSPGLMPDRLKVSPAARHVWEVYAKRPDVEPIDLADYHVRLHDDDVLDRAYTMKGSGPDIASLRARHDPENSSNVSDAGRRFANNMS
jgi:hypothetical protein